MMTALVTSILLAISAPASVLSEPSLSQENRSIVRCAAAFSIIAHGQSLGNAEARKWPDVETRGREYFVRGLARIMDDTGLNRAELSHLVSTEAQRLRDEGLVDQVMPPCLILLDASGI